MNIRQFDIWLANLNPAKGTEPGKIRPVVIVQTNLLNEFHPSTLICPLTSNTIPGMELLRVNVPQVTDRDSDILVDQLRAIDNKRLIKKLGKLSKEQILHLKRNLKIVLDL